jgi:alpha-glucosidase
MGNDWFLGAITGHAGKVIQLNSNFLQNGNWEATTYSDSEDAGVYPNKVNKQIQMIASNASIELKLAPGGGAVMHIVKK